MDLHYLTLMGRNLENNKKLTPVQIMNCVVMNSKNVVNIADVFSDCVAIHSILSEEYRDEQSIL